MLMYKHNPALPIVGVGSKFDATKGISVPQELGVILEYWDTEKPSISGHEVCDVRALQNMSKIPADAPAAVRINNKSQISAALKALDIARHDVSKGKIDIEKLPRVSDISAIA